MKYIGTLWLSLARIPYCWQLDEVGGEHILHAITQYTLHTLYTCGWWEQAVMEADHSLVPPVTCHVSRKPRERETTDTGLATQEGLWNYV